MYTTKPYNDVGCQEVVSDKQSRVSLYTLYLCRSANRVRQTLTHAAVDVMLQLCAEQPSTVCAFVEACSSPTAAADCLQKMALLWRAVSVETEQLEKVSILLQKLSKVR